MTWHYLFCTSEESFRKSQDSSRLSLSLILSMWWSKLLTDVCLQMRLLRFPFFSSRKMRAFSSKKGKFVRFRATESVV